MLIERSILGMESLGIHPQYPPGRSVRRGSGSTVFFVKVDNCTIVVSAASRAGRFSKVIATARVMPGGSHLTRMACAALLVTMVLGADAVRAQTMVPWVTRSADNARSGWNSHETALSQAIVEQKGIVRSMTIPVDGDAHGMEDQPLILPGVKVGDGSEHDMLVLSSMANLVRAVDAHSGADLWANDPTLGTPIKAAGWTFAFDCATHTIAASLAMSAGEGLPATGKAASSASIVPLTIS